jgi:hypothetical protein
MRVVTYVDMPCSKENGSLIAFVGLVHPPGLDLLTLVRIGSPKIQQGVESADSQNKLKIKVSMTFHSRASHGVYIPETSVELQKREGAWRDSARLCELRVKCRACFGSHLP